MALQTDAYRALFLGKLHLGRAACSGPVADARGNVTLLKSEGVVFAAAASIS